MKNTLAPGAGHNAAKILAMVCALALNACGGDTLPVEGTDTGPAGDSADGTVNTDATPGTDALADVADAPDTPDALADAPTDEDVPPMDVPPDVPQTDMINDMGPGKCSPDQMKACNDNLACTTDKCTMPGGVCAWTMSDGWCFINGNCIGAGETKPGEPCFVCDPAVSTKAWSALADGKACDDGDLCTYDGTCQSQKCVSKPTPCGDSNPCTDDKCDKLLGCLYPNVAAGTACNDGNACTLADACTQAECAGKAINCDDKNPCTDDACDIATGCTYTNHEGACSDGDECTTGDACAGGACQKGVTKNCDDGNTCTFDVCEPKTLGGCYHLAKQSPCCTGVTSICDDGNPCTSDDCDPATSDCTHVNNSASCDDANACSSADICSGGACAGSSITCNDSNPCTNDSCDKALGCVFTPIAANACDDGKPCTDDACDPVSGCKHGFNTVACEDGDNCTVNDACKDGACASGTARNCDDGNVCTYDQCIATLVGGCYHLATKSPCCTGVTSICDDGNTCTNDDCDPATSACLHSNNTAPCNDGTACTTSDTCAGGACTGAALSCDDGNPCTTDNCDPKVGCAHGNIDGGACDDNNPCTTADACTAGKCVGQGQCTCTMAFSNQADKFTSLQVGASGMPGEGLDVDANANTCSPSGNCSSGIDNGLGAIATLINKPLGDAVTKGSVMFVLEYRDVKQGAISLGLYTAKVADSNAACDFQTATCDYDVAKSLVDYIKCLPSIDLAGKLAGNVIKAGGKGTNFPFSLPLAGAQLQIVIQDTQLSGTVTFDGAGKIATFDGVLGGAVPGAQLTAAINALPDGALTPPFDKATLTGLLPTLLDMDTNGDGTPDTLSVGLKIHGIPANIVGTY